MTPVTMTYATIAPIAADDVSVEKASVPCPYS